MFIGPRGVLKTPTRGRFHCPHCGVPRPYAYRRFRRYFALFHVPIVPLEDQQEFVQCGYCRRAFQPSVLESGRLGADGRGEVAQALVTELNGPAASTLLVWESTGE